MAQQFTNMVEKGAVALNLSGILTKELNEHFTPQLTNKGEKASACTCRTDVCQQSLEIKKSKYRPALVTVNVSE